MATKRKKKVQQRALKAPAKKRRFRSDIFQPTDPGGSRIESASIEWEPAELEVSKAQYKKLLTEAKSVMAGLRESVERKADGRRRFAKYLDVSAYAFGESLNQFAGGKTLDVAKRLVEFKFQMGAETSSGKVLELLSTASLPLRLDFHWARLDSDDGLKERLQESLGVDIVRNVDLYGVHADRSAGKVLRMVGLKLNGKTANASILKYGSNSFSDTDTILRFAKAEGADRVEIVIGVAYDKSDAQPRSMLTTLAKKLGEEWKLGTIGDDSQSLCLRSPDCRMQFRVLVGPKLGGYLMKPCDDIRTFDLAAVLTRAQGELGGRRTLYSVANDLAADMDAVAKANMEAFLQDSRFSYLRNLDRTKAGTIKRIKRAIWLNMHTGSWVDIRS